MYEQLLIPGRMSGAMAPDIWPITADISQCQTYGRTAKNAKNERQAKKWEKSYLEA